MTTAGGPRELIIIGSGPAALTAAIYAARANLNPLVLASSVSAGGDLMTTTEVDNFPGFPDGVQGPELMAAMQEQAEKFGAEVVYDDVVDLRLHGETKQVTIGDGTVHDCLAVIFATGSAYRKLNLPDEERLSGHGISWCATCDGFFFREKTIAVVGGGDSALEEALFLTKFAAKVYVLVRSRLRASKAMQDRANRNPKIEFIFDSAVVALHGDDHLSGVTLVTPYASRHLPLDGLFVAVGSDPRTHLVHGKLALTVHGTVEVDGRSSRTSQAGVFAAGDVIDPTYRQAVTAAASGTVAALDVEHYLASLTSTSRKPQ
ncbi:thioredoxin-disulfide reductase (plasmid) [Glaciihabitans sp. INWT7]|uniref:NAD(P)/FAD-dependent oxidoreductase n=1 Tax=Glaciihabitans sp. INWT7 TaxID=2596912 RepID=UPI00162935E9|nr:FAD-dependent oxidoreductase [Glaciihabitans sp. INWT7]QNE48697.1 thioredoxin-disulfide reductase [Glaciihabitans sp. INWT7]